MRTRILKLLAVLTLGAVIGLPGMALAYPVGPGDFGAGATVESFEAVQPNNPANGTGPLESNNFTIGRGVATSLASGVAFTAPLLANGNWYYNGDPFINDFALGSQQQNAWSWGGWVYITPGIVPDGTAWAGVFNANYGNGERTLEFTLPGEMQRVGAYVAGPKEYSITMKAYDDAGNLLDTQVMAFNHPSQWGSSFIGIGLSDADIAKVTFSAVDMGLDKLTFESDSPQVGVSVVIPLPPDLPEGPQFVYNRRHAPLLA